MLLVLIGCKRRDRLNLRIFATVAKQLDQRIWSSPNWRSGWSFPIIGMGQLINKLIDIDYCTRDTLWMDKHARILCCCWTLCIINDFVCRLTQLLGALKNVCSVRHSTLNWHWRRASLGKGWSYDSPPRAFHQSRSVGYLLWAGIAKGYNKGLQWMGWACVTLGQLDKEEHSHWLSAAQ